MCDIIEFSSRGLLLVVVPIYVLPFLFTVSHMTNVLSYCMFLFTVSHMTNVLSYCMLCGFVASFVAGLTFDWQKRMYSSMSLVWLYLVMCLAS